MSWMYGPSLALEYLYHDDYLISQVTLASTCTNHPQYLYYLVDLFRPGALAIKCLLGLSVENIEQLPKLKYVGFILVWVAGFLFFKQIKFLVNSSVLATFCALFLVSLPSFQQTILNLANVTHIISWLLSFCTGIFFCNLYAEHEGDRLQIKNKLFIFTLLFCSIIIYPLSTFSFLIPVLVVVLSGQITRKKLFTAAKSIGFIVVAQGVYLICKNLVFNHFGYLLQNPTTYEINFDLSQIFNFYFIVAPSWYLGVFSYGPISQFSSSLWLTCFLFFIVLFLAKPYIGRGQACFAFDRLLKILCALGALFLSILPIAATNYQVFSRLFISFEPLLFVIIIYLLRCICSDYQFICEKLTSTLQFHLNRSVVKVTFILSGSIAILFLGFFWQRELLEHLALPNYLEFEKTHNAIAKYYDGENHIHIITPTRPSFAKSPDEFYLVTSNFPQDVQFLVKRAFLKHSMKRPQKLMVTNGPKPSHAVWPPSQMNVDTSEAFVLDLRK